MCWSSVDTPIWGAQSLCLLKLLFMLVLAKLQWFAILNIIKQF
jgi:hypothetical protein